ncbi:MAG: hypothetical protein JNL38_13190 [Myxococcales bacterium]|nr:hypothetical protein [Myxococcales bacterium]
MPWLSGHALRRGPIAALAFAATALAPGCARGRPAPASPLATASPAACDGAAEVDVVEHAVELSVDVSPPRLEGRGRITIRARAPTRAVRLDTARLSLLRVAAGGRELAHGPAGRGACVALERELAAGAAVDLDLAWRADAPGAGASPSWRGGATWAGYATPSWMPTVARASARAALRLSIDAPADLAVVASGALVERVPAGPRATHRFSVEPAPTFLFAWAVGPFSTRERRVDGEVLAVHGPPDLPLDRVLDATEVARRFLERRLGARLPEGRYAQVVVPGDAAQEAVSLALVGDEHVRAFASDPHEDWIFAHELAHQWFGRAIPCADFADFWLNEGFATYLVAAVKEEAWGRAAYDREVALWRARSQKVTAAQKDAPLAPRPGAALPLDPEPAPRGLTYARGALVLHRLRAELGDDAFWRGLARYVADRSGKGARSADLRRALEAATGRDLGAFFDRWVYAAAPDA